MRRLSITAVVAGVVLAGAATAVVAQAPSASNNAAVADAARPAADKERDVHRKPAEMLTIAEIKPGSKVGELIPGGGYFTRIFSKAVGPSGKVYAITNPPAAGRPAPAVRALAADANYPNVVVVEGNVAEFKLPEPVDVVWTSQNYHDIPPEGRALLNKAAFAALKPGGIYIVLDHKAADGAGEGVHRTMHRADEAIVKAEVPAAGFKLDKEFDNLRNPKDDHTKAVFDGAVRGDTDQFILRYRKPK
jgi:predicted methyltransferase